MVLVLSEFCMGLGRQEFGNGYMGGSRIFERGSIIIILLYWNHFQNSGTHRLGGASITKITKAYKAQRKRN